MTTTTTTTTLRRLIETATTSLNGLLQDLQVEHYRPLDHLAPGEHVVLLGSEGSGLSSTLTTMATRLLAEDGGFVYLDGKGDISLHARLYVAALRAGRETDHRVVNLTSAARSKAHYTGHRLQLATDWLPEDLADEFRHHFGTDVSLTEVLRHRLGLVVLLPALEKSRAEMRQLTQGLIGEIHAGMLQAGCLERDPRRRVIFLDDVLLDREGMVTAQVLMRESRKAGLSVVVSTSRKDIAEELRPMTTLYAEMKHEEGDLEVKAQREGQAVLTVADPQDPRQQVTFDYIDLYPRPGSEGVAERTIRLWRPGPTWKHDYQSAGAAERDRINARMKASLNALGIGRKDPV